MGLVDLTYLKEMSDGSNELIIEMIEIFKEQYPEFKNDFKTHLKNKDNQALASLAHKAKSSLAIMGLNELANDIKTLEALAKEEKEVETYKNYVNKFILVCEKALIEFDEIIKKLSKRS